jgi:GNAT superfamily N-acetyltransferase
MPARRAAKLKPVQAPFAPRAADVNIVEVRTPAERDAFVRFQPEHYANDPLYVPQIIAERRDFVDPSRNPYFSHARAAFFLAYRQGRVVGRIAAVNDSRHNQFHDVSHGFFGLFECQNDPSVASALFQSAAQWHKAEGLSLMLGPLNLSYHHDLGLLVEGFDKPPGMNLPYNPRYYARLFELNGFAKHKDLFSYELAATPGLPEKVTRFAQRMRERGHVTIRRINVAETDTEVPRIKSIYDSMLKNGPGAEGFYPLTDAEFDQAVNRLRPLIMMRPELCFMAEANGEAVAFCITVPDMNQALRAAGGHLSRFGLPVGLLKMLWAARKIDRVRVLTFGIKPGFRRRGIDALMVDEVFRAAKKLGYTAGECGWVDENDRLINRTIAATGAKRIKVYRLYERAL